jgi:hypothetical protein
MISALRTTGVRTYVPRGAVLALTRRTQRLIRRACLATVLLVMIAAVAQPVHRGVGRSRCDLRERRAIVGSVASGPGSSGRRAEQL